MNLDFIIGKYYSINTMKEAGFNYLSKSSTPEWKVYSKEGIRVHLNYGEYRFSYIPERGVGQIVGSFGMVR